MMGKEPLSPQDIPPSPEETGLLEPRIPLQRVLAHKAGRNLPTPPIVSPNPP